MGIGKFFIILLLFTVAFLFVEKEKPQIIVQTKEKPKVRFIDSTMYEITDITVNQIVKSKKVEIYNDKEKLQDAVIVVKSEKNHNDTSVLSGNNILKKQKDVYLSGDVNLQLSNGTDIKTEYLVYNTETKIATNTVDFIAKKNNILFTGNSLYLDSINEHIVAKKTKFRMKVENE